MVDVLAEREHRACTRTIATGGDRRLESSRSGDGVRHEAPFAADDSYNATSAVMGSPALSVPHMHEDGGWTICDRDDCDVVLAKSRARKVRGYLAIGVVASFPLILGGSALLGSNSWSRVGVIFLCGVLYPIFLRRLLIDRNL
jgi:hypothetical protein